MSDLINVADFERLAAEKLEPGALGYFAGGAGDEVTLRDNVAAWRRWRLRPRVLADVGEVDDRGRAARGPVSMPLLVAPVAFQRLVAPRGRGGDGPGRGGGRDRDVPLDPRDDPARARSPPPRRRAGAGSSSTASGTTR